MALFSTKGHRGAETFAAPYREIPFRYGRVFCSTRRLGQFVPSQRGPRSFTPTPPLESQPQLVFLPLITHESCRLFPLRLILLAEDRLNLRPLSDYFVRCRLLPPGQDQSLDAQSGIPDLRKISRGKFDRLQHTAAGFTTGALDGYGLCNQLPARPASYASHPVLVHRLAPLLRASFRRHVTVAPLRFAMNSPPSGCQWDSHPQAVKHARRTTGRAGH